MDTVTINVDNLSENDRKLAMELKAKADRPRAWKPKLHCGYWFVGYDGTIKYAHWTDNAVDKFRFNTGNCYETKEAAEFAREKAIVQGELQRYAEEHNEGVIDWNDKGQAKRDLRYDHYTNRLYSDDWIVIQTQNAVYFTSEKTAKAAIAAIGADRIKKYIFGVE